MTKWLIIGVLAVLILFVAVSEMMEEEWYEGYMAGMAEHEKMMRKEKADGKEREEKSA
jgi:hypothetical protein